MFHQESVINGGHRPVHGSAHDAEMVLLGLNLLNIIDHIPGKNQDQNIFQISVTGFHQYPWPMRTELPCIDTSDF